MMPIDNRPHPNPTAIGKTLRHKFWHRPELWVALLAAVTYANSIGNQFCDDGVPIVQENAFVQEPGHWCDIWTTDHWYEARDANPNRDLLYRPLALVTYRWIVVLAGPGPMPQLVTNVLLHALVCMLVVLVARLTLRSDSAAGVAGAVFAVLPIHTEVVNNVVGRADLLSAAAVLVTLLCHNRLLHTKRLRDTLFWLSLAAGGSFCSMAAKESGAAVVALVPLYHLFLTTRRTTESQTKPWYGAGSLAKLSYLIVAACAYLALRYNALGGVLFQKPALTKTVNVLVDAPAWQHWLGVLQLWGMYWLKTVWPTTLTVNYSIHAIRLATSMFDRHVLLGLGVALLLFLAAWRSWVRGHRTVTLLVLAILISYAPTANALVLIQVFFAERIWYLPSVWVAMLVGLAVIRVPQRPVAYVLGLAIVFAFSARCWIRNSQWRNNLTLYASAYQAHPNSIGALHLYGQALLNRGQADLAIQYLVQAIHMDQGFTDAHRTLGNAYLAVGNMTAALRQLQIANMQAPGHPTTERSLTYARQQMTARSAPVLAALRQQAAINPADLGAQLALIAKLRDIGQLEQAAEVLRLKDDTFTESAQWQREYAITLVLLNKVDQAIDRYERSAALDATNPNSLIELAMLYLERRKSGDLERARYWAKQAAVLAPKAANVLACRAELAALRGEITQALQLYRQAIESLPINSTQRTLYQQRARTLGLEPG